MVNTDHDKEVVGNEEGGSSRVRFAEDGSIVVDEAPWEGDEVTWRSSLFQYSEDRSMRGPRSVFPRVDESKKQITMSETAFDTVIASLKPRRIKRRHNTVLRPARWPTLTFGRAPYAMIVALTMLVSWVVVDSTGVRNTQGAVDLQSFDMMYREPILIANDIIVFSETTSAFDSQGDTASIVVEPDERDDRALEENDVSTLKKTVSTQWVTAAMAPLKQKMRRCGNQLGGPVKIEIEITGETGRVVSAKPVGEHDANSSSIACMMAVLKNAKMPISEPGHLTFIYTVDPHKILRDR